MQIELNEYEILLAQNKLMKATLEKVASWKEGPVVTPKFDCPSHTILARQCLGECEKLQREGMQ